MDPGSSDRSRKTRHLTALLESKALNEAPDAALIKQIIANNAYERLVACRQKELC